jgi:hypothetical protein
METTMAPILVEGVYEHLVGYRDTILKHHRWLCGDEIGPSAATDSWQIYAANMATTLRNYARLLEALGNGTLGFNGPVVFPSWEPELKEPEGDKGYDDVSIFMAAVRHDIRLNKEERKKAEGGAS